VSHKVQGDCHFLRSGCRLGSIQEQKVTRKKLGCTNQNEEKKSYTTQQKFRTIEPKILYFGTPAALVSSLNEDGSTHLAPISSFCALRWTLILGLLTETETADNVARHRECVVNLPSPEMWQNVQKAGPDNRKKSCAKTQIRAVPFGAAQVCGGRAHSLGRAKWVSRRGPRNAPVHKQARVTELHQLNAKKLS
jgi:hypothetical protein